MNFIVKGLDPSPFRHLFGRTDAELKSLGVIRYTANASPGFPDRIEMRDVSVGERLLLLNHTSMDKPSPYQAAHAIYIREGAEVPYEAHNQIPDVMSSRMLSLRAFDQNGMMLDAELATGEEVKNAVVRLLANDAVEHIDAHNATRGCFSGRIVRGE